MNKKYATIMTTAMQIAPQAHNERANKAENVRPSAQLAALKAWLDSPNNNRGSQGTQNKNIRLRFDIPEIDSRLDGGLAACALHEIRCPLARDAPAGIAFIASLLSRLKNETHKLLWVSDPSLRSENATLYPKGLAEFGLDPAKLVIVNPVSLQTTLWAADEAARCNELAAIVLHLKGNPRSFDMTASRRLMLRAQTSKTLCIVLRQSGEEEASAAATRWCLQSAPSTPHPNIHRSIGNMRLGIALERNRNGQTGHWQICWNHHKRAFENVSPTTQLDRANIKRPTHPFNRSATSAHRPHSTQQMGQVMALGRAS